MDKKQIVRSFVEKGILLSPELVGSINQENREMAMQIAKSSGGTVFTSMEGQKQENISVKIKAHRQKKKLGVQDFVKYYNNKYESIKKVLSKKMDAVSISNATQSFSEVSVIGMVRELLPKGFVLEDPTGELSVAPAGGNEQVAVDDVIGVTGSVREGKLFAKNIIFPDVPLNNKPGQLAARIIMATDCEKLGDKPSGFDFVVCPGHHKSSGKNIITGFGNPGWITMLRGKDKLEILVFSPDETIDPQHAIMLLKKRHLSPKRGMVVSPEDLFVIDKVPAVFWIVQKDAWNGNYKGVNIVSCGQGSFAEIDLLSKETKINALG